MWRLAPARGASWRWRLGLDVRYCVRRGSWHALCALELGWWLQLTCELARLRHEARRPDRPSGELAIGVQCGRQRVNHGFVAQLSLAATLNIGQALGEHFA